MLTHNKYFGNKKIVEPFTRDKPAIPGTVEEILNLFHITGHYK